MAKVKEQKKLLLQQTLDLNAVADYVPAMIAVYNINTGEYVYVNPSVKRILGYTAEEFMTRGLKFVASLVHPADLARIMAENQAALMAANQNKPEDDTGEPIASFEYRMKHKNGKWVWLHTDGSVFNRDKTGRVELVLNASLDVTVSKETEKSILVLNRQLATLNRAKDEFIAIASHQLRTPATVVKQYTSLLLQGYAGKLSPRQKKYVETAFQSNERQLGLANDLLRVAKLDAGKLRLAKASHDIVGLVLDIVQQQAASFSRKRQKLTFEGGNEQILAPIDKELVRSAIENIVDNAHKYSPLGGRAIVYVTRQPGGVLIRVSDNGKGIAKKDMNKLFQKFSRIDTPLDATLGGSGLGLYWARKVVELHDGHINVVSKPGIGSDFVIDLPAHAATFVKK